MALEQHSILGFVWFDNRARIILLILLIAALNTQGAQGQIIEAVRFQGNKNTKERFLKLFTETSEGQQLDSIQLEKDRQQLVNLEMFADAKFEVHQTGDKVTITFYLTELFTFIPFINFGRINENFWTKIGVSEVNFLGSGHKITGYHQFYDRHSMAMHLQLQRIKGKPLSINLNMIKWGTLEPLFFPEGTTIYNYDNYNVGGDIMYHLNLTDHVLIGGALFREVYDAAEMPVEGAPDFAAINKSLFKVQFSSYRVNSHFYFRDGVSKFFTAEVVHAFNGDPTFWISFTEWKLYKRYRNRGNLAVRIKLGLSSNEQNPFAPFVLDSYLNVRGVGDRVDRGTGMLVSNIEYRHTLWEGEQYAFTTVGFVDLGGWRQPGGGMGDFLAFDNQVAFSGIGTRLIHKKIYNAIFRVDFGWDVLHQTGGGLVLGIGQYF